MFFEAAFSQNVRGSVIAAGTGRTITQFFKQLNDEFFHNNFFVSTSLDTERTLLSRGAKIISISSVKKIDLYIDGADVVLTSKPVAIKGYGGALYREKTCYLLSETSVLVVDSNKLKTDLSQHLVPFEVMPVSGLLFEHELEKRKINFQLRTCSGGKFGAVVTENGGLVYDLSMADLDNSTIQALMNLPGVVCHGVFWEKTFKVIVLDEKRVIEY